MLPSYLDATEPNILSLVAEYLSPRDVIASAGVSTEWREALVPLIWKSPLLYFPRGFVKGDLILATIPKTLQKFVTVLDFESLSKANPSMDASYKSYIIHRLFLSLEGQKYSNLRFIYLNTWEHYSLTIYDDVFPQNAPIDHFRDHDITRTFAKGAWTFSASGCLNYDCFGEGFFSLVGHQLLCLDVSGTNTKDGLYPTREKFPNLRVLKLHHLGLNSSRFPPLACDNHYRIWSLDIRNNRFDGGNLASLLNHNFLDLRPEYLQGLEKEDGDESRFEDPPVYDSHAPPHNTTKVPLLRPDDLEGFSEELLDGSGLNAHSELVYDPESSLLSRTGCTHLYISGNRFTARMISKVLNLTYTLQVLDTGSVRHISLEDELKNPYRYLQAQPFTSHLLSRKHSPKLETLRIHHSVVTLIPIALARNGQTLTQFHEMTTIAHTELENHAAFAPQSNNRLRKLTLTGVPRIYDLELARRLFKFLDRAREQEAELNALRMNSRRRSPPVLAGLRHLRLEFLPEPKKDEGGSVSEDADAETFHKASEGDFSFFGEEEGAKEEADKQEGSGAEKWKMPGPSLFVEELNIEAVAVVELAGRKLFIVDILKALKAFRALDGPWWGGKLEVVMLSEHEDLNV